MAGENFHNLLKEDQDNLLLENGSGVYILEGTSRIGGGGRNRRSNKSTRIVVERKNQFFIFRTQKEADDFLNSVRDDGDEG